MMEKKNEMKDMLLYCIHIARHKGVFYEKPDFDKAEEYIKNMLDQDEIERILRREKFTHEHAVCPGAIAASKIVIEKLEKQKELL